VGAGVSLVGFALVLHWCGTALVFEGVLSGCSSVAGVVLLSQPNLALASHSFMGVSAAYVLVDASVGFVAIWLDSLETHCTETHEREPGLASVLLHGVSYNVLGAFQAYCALRLRSEIASQVR